MSTINERLTQLGITLPAAKTPAFEYVAVALHDGIAHVSGQLPWLDSERVISGKVGADCDLEQAQEAARLCILFGLAALNQQLGSLDAIERILKVTGFVASAPGFVSQPKVIDAASRLLGEIFGEIGFLDGRFHGLDRRFDIDAMLVAQSVSLNCREVPQSKSK